MKPLLISLLAILVADCVTVPAPSVAPDLLIVNGKIFTADPVNRWAEALAVRGERIAAVGSSSSIRELAGPSTRVIDVGGRLVVPGFNDAHYHTTIGPDQVRLQFPTWIRPSPRWNRH